MDALHVVDKGESPPSGARAVPFVRLKQALEHPTNRRETTQLFAALGVQRRAPDPTFRAVFEHRFDLFEVPRRRLVLPVDLPIPVLGPDPEPHEVPLTWIGLALVDADGNPVPRRPYRVVTAKGEEINGTLDEEGKARIPGLDAGSCTIVCPYLAPHPKVVHEVADGDHLSGIAVLYGEDEYAWVWNDPANAELRNARTDPHVLSPGDTVTVPERAEDPGVAKPTGQTHVFNVASSPLKLRLVLLDLTGKPLADQSVGMDGEALQCDGSGLVEVDLDKTARDVQATLPSGPVDLLPGALDPGDGEGDAGWRARLYNMGFLWDASAAANDDEMVIALQDFQAQYGLAVTGSLDDATRAKIASVHGS